MQNFKSSLLPEKQAAEYLGISVYLLQRWRCQLKGPDFVRVGGPNGKAIRYRKSVLDAWIDANTVRMGRVVS
jgi:hypothetical protein